MMLLALLHVLGVAHAAPLDSIAEVRALSAEEAARGRPVRLEGVVTFSNAADFGPYGFIQDGERAIFVFFPGDAPPPRVGARVEVIGVTDPGEFAPTVRATGVRPRGDGSLPRPVDATIEALMTGRYDSRWTAVQGTVRDLGEDPLGNLSTLTVVGGGQRIRVDLPAGEALEPLRGARVRVEGVAGTLFNQGRQLVGLRVMAPSLEQVRVLSPGIKDEGLPLTAIGDLLEFSPTARPDRLVRVRGVVTSAAHRTFGMQDATGAVFVRLVEGGALPPAGHAVDVVGYAEPGALTPILVDATVRSAAPAPPLEPIRRDAADLLDSSTNGRLVRIEGTLVDRSVHPSGTALTVEVGEHAVSVLVRGAVPGAVRPGAVLQLEGVLQLLADPLEQHFRGGDSYAVTPHAAQLGVQSADDVVVLRRVPFWSLRRASMVVTALGGILALVGVWVWMLRRKVRQKTDIIRRQRDEQTRLRDAAERANIERGRFLANITQGLVLLDREGRLGPERSAAAERMLGGIESGTPFVDILRRHSPQQAEWWELGWEALQDGILPPNVSLAQLPNPLSVHGRHLAVSAASLPEGSADWEHVMLVLTDVTGDVLRERAERRQRETTALCMMFARDREGLQWFFREAEGIVGALREGREGPAGLLRRLHTLKGNAHVVGCESLGELCHRLEEGVAARQGPLDDAERRELEAEWSFVRELLEPLVGQEQRESLVVSRQEHAAVLAALEHGADVRQALHGWTLTPTRRILARLREQAERLARSLDRWPLTVELEDGGLRMDGTRWGAFWSASVHVLRNSMAHGFAAGPGEARVLRLATRLHDGELVVSFADNGRGIDWDAVRDRARAAGLPHADRDDLEAALFADGLTSASELTATAGRGVGLGALASAAAELGGRVEVVSAPGAGTTVRVRFAAAAIRGHVVREPSSGRGQRTEPDRVG